MDTQKADNQLNLALSIPQEQRENSPELVTGYVSSSNSWEVIVKYTGNLNRVREELQVQITELLNEYAIIIISQEQLPLLSNYPEIQYIEKPKILNFEVINGISASCLSQPQRPPYNLTGKGVLIGIVDSGIDYAHQDFRNPDGTTRIVALWDQTIEGNPPEGFTNGTLYTSEDINRALSETTISARQRIVPSNDLSGHGTHVAGIACGNGRASDGRYRGVAFDADIIVVKLGRSLSNSFPSTAQLMEGIDFCIRTALQRNQPLCINISFGNSYGSHSGQSLLETYIDSVVGIGKTNIIIGTGNEGASGRHKSGRVGTEPELVKITVGERETSFNLSIWKYPFDFIDVSLIAPNGTRIGPVDRTTGSQSFDLAGSTLYVYYGEPSPYTIYNEVFIVWIPKIDYVETGEWTIELNPVNVVVGDYFMWLPSGNLLSPTTKFLRPTVETTLTIPSTANSAIAVGAYNSNNDSFAPFSGRGYTINNQIKPDLVAPGVDITSSAPGGGYSELTGTSLATPFVTGACAMLQQWGIVDGNDTFMYGEKVKAILISTARKLDAFTVYPNESIGFGALCLRRVE
ncbi:MAG: S8 family peptidase [bacterium]|nr:S8 family peptidase [bacterium]